MKTGIGKYFVFLIVPAIVGILSVWGLLIQSTGAGLLTTFWDAFLSVISISIFGWVVSNILRFYRPSHGKEWMPVLWILVLAGFWLAVSWGLIKFAISGDSLYQNILGKTFWLRLFLGILILSCVALITWVGRQNSSEKRVRERYFETQELAKDAELNTIRQQLQPHFLFNSLNSIYALIASEPAKAREMIQQLSDFLRGTLRRDPAQMVTVSDEIMHTRIYLDIERVRFSERLQVVWVIDESCGNLKMPVLLLQPAVENAIKFGLYDVIENVTIKILVFKELNNLKIEIQNPFDKQTAGSSKGTGFGLDSIRRRLFLLFGRTDLLHQKTTENEFILSILIPQIA